MQIHGEITLTFNGKTNISTIEDFNYELKNNIFCYSINEDILFPLNLNILDGYFFDDSTMNTDNTFYIVKPFTFDIMLDNIKFPKQDILNVIYDNLKVSVDDSFLDNYTNIYIKNIQITDVY